MTLPESPENQAESPLSAGAETPSAEPAPSSAGSPPLSADQAPPVSPEVPSQASDVSRETISPAPADGQIGPRIIAIANQKGGVGKTTTAINLATALAAIERKVLVIDLDPQGNASTGLGIGRDKRSHSTYDLITGEVSLSETVVQSNVPRLSVIPASVDLAGAELELIDLDRREFRLRDVLEKSTIAYDYVLIDCPPALGLLTLNALVAADSILVPLQC